MLNAYQVQVKKPLQTKVAAKTSFFKGKPVDESSDDDASEDEPSDEVHALYN